MKNKNYETYNGSERARGGQSFLQVMEHFVKKTGDRLLQFWWNIGEMPDKHSWNTCETLVKHLWNINLHYLETFRWQIESLLLIVRGAIASKKTKRMYNIVHFQNHLIIIFCVMLCTLCGTLLPSNINEWCLNLCRKGPGWPQKNLFKQLHQCHSYVSLCLF